MHLISRAIHLANENAGKLFLFGIIVVGLRHLRSSQHDRNRLVQKRHPPVMPPLEQWPTLPKISLLVAAWNEENRIAAHISSVLSLRYPHLEYILCAGGDDCTLEIAQAHTCEKVTLLEQFPGDGKQRALQRCLERARGEIIFLTDSDCILDNEAFERTLSPLILEEESVATGSRKPYKNTSNNLFVLYQWYCHIFGTAQHPKYVMGLEGRNTAIWKDILDGVRGFQEPVATGTDYFLALKLEQAGYNIRYQFNSVVQTEFPTKLKEYFNQQSRWHRNEILHGFRFRRYKPALVNAMRGGVSLLTLGTPFSAFFHKQILASIGGILFINSYLTRLRGMRWGEAYDQQSNVHTPGYLLLFGYLIVELFSWVGAWIEIVFPNRRWKW